VQREVRRGSQYDGIIIEPPKFGRGPKGEVWDIYRSLPKLMEACRQLLSPQPLFVLLTLYAVPASAIHLQQMLAELTQDHPGEINGGELVTREQSAGRLLSHAVYARWRGT
jgi:23S rRNA (cytosine1962-C5)-methyltransferase